jgi:hypothetical protein
MFDRPRALRRLRSASMIPRRRLRAEALEPRTVLAAAQAVFDSFETVQDTPLVIETSELFANDVDFDRDQLSAALFLNRGPYSGTLTIHDADTLIYRPEPGFIGDDSFNYFVSDGTNDGGAQVHIKVKQASPPGGGGGGFSGVIIISPDDPGRCFINLMGAANNDCYSTLEDTPLVVAAPGVLANDYTGEAAITSLEIQTEPLHGAVSWAIDGGFTYTPAQDFFGSDQFAYESTDANGITRSAIVYIDIAPVNDPPVVANDRLTTESGIPITIHRSTLEANDRDVDNPNDVLLLVPLSTAPRNGSLAVADTNLIYTPLLGYLGSDVFTYFTTDGEYFSDGSATVTIEMTPAVRRNLVRPADVNYDGGISPVDALLIINYLNAYGSRTVAQAAQACRELVDVDGDGFVAPSDAMSVINELNALRPAGLQTAPTADTSGLNAAAVDAYVAEPLDGVPESILTGRPPRRGR